MQDFGRARYLQPNLAEMCMLEGSIWLVHDPLLAIPAWREALQRESSLSEDRFRYMLDCVKQYPELRESVRELSRSDARLMNLYLGQARNATEFNEVLQDMISRFPQLEGLSHYQRSLFFTNWRRQGDRKALMTALQSHPSWLDDGWHVLAAELGDSGKPQEAYELALKHVTPPMNLSVDPSYSLDQLQREFTFNPSDARRGFNLALLQRERRQFNESLSTLDKIAQQPNAPRAVQYEKAKVYAAMADFVKAWEMMSRYLQL